MMEVAFRDGLNRGEEYLKLHDDQITKEQYESIGAIDARIRWIDRNFQLLYLTGWRLWWWGHYCTLSREEEIEQAYRYTSDAFLLLSSREVWHEVSPKLHQLLDSAFTHLELAFTDMRDAIALISSIKNQEGLPKNAADIS